MGNLHAIHPTNSQVCRHHDSITCKNADIGMNFEWEIKQIEGGMPKGLINIFSFKSRVACQQGLNSHKPFWHANILGKLAICGMPKGLKLT